MSAGGGGGGGAPARVPPGTAMSHRSTQHVAAQVLKIGPNFHSSHLLHRRLGPDLHTSPPPTHRHPSGLPPAPSTGHLPGVGSGVLGRVIISKHSSRAPARVSSGSRGSLHTPGGCLPCQSVPSASVSLKTGFALSHTSSPWPSKGWSSAVLVLHQPKHSRPGSLRRAEARSLPRICWGIIHGKLVRNTLFLFSKSCSNQWLLSTLSTRS